MARLVERSRWLQLVDQDPHYSQAYVNRFRKLEAGGDDIVGEARLVDAMLARGSRVLDAGSGVGRIGAYLHHQGHTVVGVDVDPTLVAAAQVDHPEPSWFEADLATLDLSSVGIVEPFDAVVCAGNVMLFVAASTRLQVLRSMWSHLRPGGRAAVGFGTEKEYSAEQFFHDAQLAGFDVELRLASWDLQPWQPGSSFLVAILRRPTGENGSLGVG